MKKNLKIVYAGNYSKGVGYPRTNVLLEGLSLYSNLKEVRYPLWEQGEDKEDGVKNPFKKAIPFFKSLLFFLKNVEEIKNSHAVIVGFPGYIEIFFFKLLKIITGTNFALFFDYFFSIYESLVFERKIIKKNSLLAKTLFFIDKAGLLVADKILIDTEEHRDFLCKTFNIPREKFVVIPVGESENFFSFQTYPSRKDPFIVLFFGTFLNLHGIDKIKKAIKLLENEDKLKFILIGKGKNDNIFKGEKFKNTELINKFIHPEELKKYIKKSHTILGIFGDNERAQIVIPCKIYDALASGRPVITGKTKATRSSFKNTDFIILCENSPEEIAKAIKLLYGKRIEELQILGEKAYQFYKKNFSPETLGLKLIREVENEIQ